MARNDFIYPMAYELRPGLDACVWHIGFPAGWKARLFGLCREMRGEFNPKYGLPTAILSRMLVGWVDGFSIMEPLYEDRPDDSTWLTLASEPGPGDLAYLCDILRIWVRAMYSMAKHKDGPIRLHVDEICDMFDPAMLEVSTSVEALTDTAGRSTRVGRAILPAMAVDRLLGCDLVLGTEDGARTLGLHRTGRSELMTEVTFGNDGKSPWSYGISLSVQSSPAGFDLMCVDVVTHRWLERYTGRANSQPFFDGTGIMAYVAVPGTDEYCRVRVRYDKNARKAIWEPCDAQCYAIRHPGHSLPPASELVVSPFDGLSSDPEILLPYKIAMDSRLKATAGKGVPFRDRMVIMDQLLSHLDGLAERCDPAYRAGSVRNALFHDHPNGYADRASFRSWFASCVESDGVTIEIWYDDSSDAERDWAGALRSKLEADFGTDGALDGVLRFELKAFPSGPMRHGIPKGTKQAAFISDAMGHVVRHAGSAVGSVVGSLFLLPGRDSSEWSRDSVDDPKDSIRHGFALTGRVVQFVDPSADGKGNAIELDAPTRNAIVNAAVYDLYRQLGVFGFMDGSKPGRLLTSRLSAMHVFRHVASSTGPARYMPVSLDMDLSTGITRVSCMAFGPRAISYREACLAMARLYASCDLDSMAAKLAAAPLRRKLVQLRASFRDPEDPALFLFEHGGAMAELCEGLSDSGLERVDPGRTHVPRRIDTGTGFNRLPLDLNGTGVRVVRVRRQPHVPNFYSPLGQSSPKNPSTKSVLQCARLSGVFMYNGAYWGLRDAGYSMEVLRTMRESRVNKARNDYRWPKPAEYWPVQLQDGDDPFAWAAFAFMTARIYAPDQKDLVSVPLPVHLLKCLGEYLYEPRREDEKK